jgi:hypothetical protein
MTNYLICLSSSICVIHVIFWLYYISIKRLHQKGKIAWTKSTLWLPNKRVARELDEDRLSQISTAASSRMCHRHRLNCALLTGFNQLWPGEPGTQCIHRNCRMSDWKCDYNVSVPEPYFVITIYDGNLIWWSELFKGTF